MYCMVERRPKNSSETGCKKYDPHYTEICKRTQGTKGPIFYFLKKWAI